MINKEASKQTFFNNLAKNLGRDVPKSIEKPVYNHRPQDEIYKNITDDEMIEMLEKQCKVIHTDFMYTPKEKVQETLVDVIEKYEGKSIVTWDDERFESFKVNDVLNNYNTHVWDPKKGDENVEFATHADIGITFSDATLAESGTVVLYSSDKKGRSVSLLPKYYIALIPKSTIVPRFTQAARQMNEMGKDIPSCINLITGPSNSADIEMKLIIGVHGPIKATYIVIDDK